MRTYFGCTRQGLLQVLDPTSLMSSTNECTYPLSGERESVFWAFQIECILLCHYIYMYSMCQLNNYMVDSHARGQFHKFSAEFVHYNMQINFAVQILGTWKKVNIM